MTDNTSWRDDVKRLDAKCVYNYFKEEKAQFSNNAVNLLDEFKDTIIYPNTTGLDTPNKKGSFMLNYKGADSTVILSGFNDTFDNINIVNGSVLDLSSSLVYDQSDGVRLHVGVIGKDEVEHDMAAIDVKKAGTFAKSTISLSEYAGQNIKIHLWVDSPSGNSACDWVAIPCAFVGTLK
jgi:hypothetical protein